MKEKIKQIIDTKQFHICMVILIIVAILCTVGLITLKYNVEGENNLPFELSKITVISTIEGNDNEDANNKWNLTVNQNNDIYLYIKKNENYKTTEAIQSITLNNFNQEQTAKIGERKIYKPDAKIESVIFKNTEENSNRHGAGYNNRRAPADVFLHCLFHGKTPFGSGFSTILIL